MTARAASAAGVRRMADWSSGVLPLAAAGLLAVVVGRMTQSPSHFRLVIAGVAALAAVALFSRSPRHLLYALLVWLPGMALLRRLATLVAPDSHTDPILLVLPLAAVLLVLAARDGGAFDRRSRLANAVLALQGLILLETVNPLQGSVAGGVVSLLFVLVPTLGFWIGRGLCDEHTMGTVLEIVAVVAVGVAVYGLSQTFHGFTSWDQRWIANTAFGSLNVHGVTRPFGTLSSAAEYGALLSVGLVVWVVHLSRRARVAPFALAAIALLGIAAFLESSRGLVVMTIAALGVTLGARLRLPGVAAAVLALVLLVGLGAAVRHFSVNPANTTVAGALTAHQLEGLSNPLDPNASTATAHWSLLVNGLRSAIDKPIGRGTGSITIAGQRFGGIAAGTELDPSNAAVALGIPGLLAYVLVSVLGFRTLYARGRRGGVVAVAALGISAVMVMQWLNGGEYAVAILPWLMLGWADRERLEDDA